MEYVKPVVEPNVLTGEQIEEWFMLSDAA